MSLVHRVEELVDEQGNALVGKAAHWERVPLHLVATVINGFPFPSGGFNTTEGEPVIRIRDVTSGQVGTYFKGNVANAPKVNHGDLVLGMDGDFNSRLWPGDTALMNQRVCKVIPDDRYYSKALLAYVIPGYLKLVNDHTSAITVKHLSSRTVQDLPLALPPRPEQDRLVSKLDELFSRIDEGERALEQVQKLVERYRQSVLQAAVTGDLTREWREKQAKSRASVEAGGALLARILFARREAWEKAELEKMDAKGIRPKNDKWKQKYSEPSSPEADDLPSLPEGWVWASMDQLSWASSYGTSEKCSYESSGPSVLRIPNIRSGCYVFEDVKYAASGLKLESADLVRKGDLLVVRTNGSDRIIGIGAVLLKKPALSCYFASYLIRFRLVMQSDLSDWVNYCWQSQVVRSFINKKKATSAGQYNISQSKLMGLCLPIPPAKERLAIVDQIDRHLSKARAASLGLENQIKAAFALRQAVLKSALAGELVLRDPSDEPASALLNRLATERGVAAAMSKHGTKIKKKSKK